MTASPPPPPSPGGTPAEATQTPAGSPVKRFLLLAGSVAGLLLGAWLLQPSSVPEIGGVWGLLLGDRLVVGALRFTGLVMSAFLLASIVMLVYSGWWLRRAGGADTAPVKQLVDRDKAVDEDLEAAEETIRELLELLDEETRPPSDPPSA